MLKRTTILLCTLWAGGFVIGLASRVAETQGNPNPGVIPPQAHPYGLSYGEWGARWWRWAYAFAVAYFPSSQAGEVDCFLGQSGSVWFLGGSTGEKPFTRSCTIPTGTALFFPIVNYLRLSLSGPLLPTGSRTDPGGVSGQGGRGDHRCRDGTRGSRGRASLERPVRLPCDLGPVHVHG
jgi:hypothetical protein